MSSTAPNTEKLYSTRNCLHAPVRAQLVETLNRRLADAIDLQCQCKQAHWIVKGPNFIALHKLFDEVHAGVESYVDLLAERVVQLGGVALGTIESVAEFSELDEYPTGISKGDDHVKALSIALAAFGSRIWSTIQTATELNDADSADICTEISRGTDKWLWFVEAHIQTKP